MAKKEYVIYEDSEGAVFAHTDNYEPKEGETEVGRVEANSVAQAEKKFLKEQKKAGDDGDTTDIAEAEAESAEHARELEDAKEDFEVLADSQGNPYVAGEDGDPARAKKKVAKAEPPELEESSLGVFRAKDAKEALAKATGAYKDPSEGMPRGAQTP